MKKTIAILVCMLLCIGSFPFPANTEEFYDSSVFSNRDLLQSPDLSNAVSITLTETSADCASDSVQIDGSRLTITKEGIYVLSGVLMDGQIIVDAGNDAKVQLALNGVQIASNNSAAIFCKQADKVFITLMNENYLANGGSYTSDDETSIDAVIFSKTDLTLNGTGTLTINAMTGHGIVSKDNLIITGGSYKIDAEGHGITGKDCIAITGGSFSVTAGKDGIHSKHDSDPERGYLYIAEGNFDIQSGDEGISATGNLQIDNGTFNIVTGGGSENGTMKTSDDFGGRFGGFQGGLVPGGDMTGQGRGRGGWDTPNRETTSDGETSATPKSDPGSGNMPDMQAPHDRQTPPDGSSIAMPSMEPDGYQMPFNPQEQSSEDSIGESESNGKGIKADGSLLIRNGTFILDCTDDAIHSNTDITICGGTWTIRTADDAIHAETVLSVLDGTFTIPYCYEGLEGETVVIENGVFDITATDDGINAAGGADNSGGWGMGFGSSNASITINGGSITIVSGGDSIDSNGSLTLNGGTLILTCNGNDKGDTAIDFDGTFTNNGANITTNDGSEDGDGHPFGMGSGRGNFPGITPPSDGRPSGGSERSFPSKGNVG